MCICSKNMSNIKLSQLNKKCGYCGWIFTHKMDLFKHSCFSEHDETTNSIVIDENNVVTIQNYSCTDSDFTQESQNVEMSADELLIACVAQKPALYDHRLPVTERTLLKKNALWQEVCNMMGGIMDVATIKKRWKYLKDCYMKDKKKSDEYIPSGSAAPATRSNTFRFYEAMSFLSDCVETRQTISTLSKNLPASSSPLSLSSISSMQSSATAKEYSTSSSSNDNFQSSKKRKSSIRDEGTLDEAFIKALNEPVQNDPIHGYVLSLADGLRRLPYKERAKLQIEFLSRIMEIQTELDS